MPLSHIHCTRGFALAVLVLAAALAAGCKKDTKKDAPAGDDPAPGPTGGADGKVNGGGRGGPGNPGGATRTVPSGFGEVNDTEVGFSCLLPGTPRHLSQIALNNPKIVDQSGTNWAQWRSELPNGDGDAEIWVYVAKNKTYGKTPDEIVANVRGVTWLLLREIDVVLSMTPVTVNGRPGVDLHFRWATQAELAKDPKTKEFFKDVEQTLEHSQLRVVSDGNRLFLIRIRDREKEPDAQVVKTVFDSFTIK
jgi:hypothetical protein